MHSPFKYACRINKCFVSKRLELCSDLYKTERLVEDDFSTHAFATLISYINGSQSRR